MRLLDLFCGAGGAGMGYHRAGFEVVGVDCKPQKNYPFEFHQADAFAYLEQHGHEFDVIHASPPCQAYSFSTAQKDKHPDYIPFLRPMLQGMGKPYVIENVLGAPLHFPITFCATMFGLPPSIQGWYLRRHRLFESPLLVLGPGGCSCDQVITAQVTGHLHKTGQSGMRHRKPGRECAKTMMGIDWMTTKELTESIPPAYTEWIGRQLQAVALSTGRLLRRKEGG